MTVKLKFFRYNSKVTFVNDGCRRSRTGLYISSCGLFYCAEETTLEFERVTYCFYSLTRVMDKTVAQTSLLPTRSTDKSICNVFP